MSELASASTSARPISSLATDGPAVLYAGDDGHLYLTLDGGVTHRRLSWANEDFSVFPGMPALPGSAGELEEDWHFAHPTPSPDGSRVAAFGLLPADDDIEQYAIEELDLEAEVEGTFDAVPPPREDWSEPSDEPLWVPENGEDDVAGPGLLPVSLPEGEVVAVPVGSVPVEQDEEEPGFWPGARVYVMHRDGVQVWEAWGFDDGGPITLDWTPDGQHLLVLHQAGEALDLHLVSPEREEPRHIVSGAPIFWGWQPGGDRLALRVVEPGGAGPTLQLGTPLTNDTLRLIDQAGSFYAPAWRPDGSGFVYGAAGDREDRIVLAGPDGHALADLIGYPGRAAFRWSPDGRRLAVPVAPEGTGTFLALEVLNLDEGTSVTRYQEPFLAAFWLPDGRSLLLCAANPETGRLQWVRVNDSGAMHPVGPAFSPSEETLVALHFFDQVTDRRSFLSHDGTHVVWSGRALEPILHAGTPGEEDDGAHILLAPLDGGPTRSLGSGRFACFPGAWPSTT